jgi:hypothetical protein
MPFSSQVFFRFLFILFSTYTFFPFPSQKEQEIQMNFLLGNVPSERIDLLISSESFFFNTLSSFLCFLDFYDIFIWEI